MSDRPVIDLGAGENPDPRADETVDLYSDATYRFDLRDEWVLPDDYAHGLVARHVIEHLPNLEHFFGEAARVLEPGGFLEVTVPVGLNAETDPGHVQTFTLATFERFCRERSRPWDPETEFILEHEEIDVWLLGPFAPFTRLFQVAAREWPGWGVRRCGSGEISARYMRT